MVQGGSETILLAEDHEGLRQLALETLTGLGYRVLAVADGEQAVREFQAHSDRVNLLLLDVMLPRLSGPEAYARIYALKPELPVIFATGYSPDLALLQKVQLEGWLLATEALYVSSSRPKVRETLDQRAHSVLHD